MQLSKPISCIVFTGNRLRHLYDVGHAKFTVSTNPYTFALSLFEHRRTRLGSTIKLFTPTHRRVL
jgi:hypothetical protein